MLHQTVRREFRLLADLTSWAPADDAVRTAEITRHADLKGKRIGIASFGGATEWGLNLGLREWNIPRDSVTVTAHGPGANRLLALSTKGVDAALLAPPETAQAERDGMRAQWLREKEIIADLRRRTDVFDDWGMFAYTSGNTGVDYLTEIDVGIWEQRLDEETWNAWVVAAALSWSTSARGS